MDSLIKLSFSTLFFCRENSICPILEEGSRRTISTDDLSLKSPVESQCTHNILNFPFQRSWPFVTLTTHHWNPFHRKHSKHSTCHPDGWTSSGTRLWWHWWRSLLIRCLHWNPIHQPMFTQTYTRLLHTRWKVKVHTHMSTALEHTEERRGGKTDSWNSFHSLGLLLVVQY